MIFEGVANLQVTLNCHPSELLVRPGEAVVHHVRGNLHLFLNRLVNQTFKVKLDAIEMKPNLLEHRASHDLFST